MDRGGGEAESAGDDIASRQQDNAGDVAEFRINRAYAGVERSFYLLKGLVPATRGN